MSEEMKKFGEVYVGSDGKEYFRVGRLGYSTKFLKPFRAKCEKFGENWEEGKEAKTLGGWFFVKLSGFSKPFILHNNAVVASGVFKEGEELEGVISPSVYEGYDGFLIVRRVINSE
jgi:hypothetical protein